MLEVGSKLPGLLSMPWFGVPSQWSCLGSESQEAQLTTGTTSTLASLLCGRPSKQAERIGQLPLGSLESKLAGLHCDVT